MLAIDKLIGKETQTSLAYERAKGSGHFKELLQWTKICKCGNEYYLTYSFTVRCSQVDTPYNSLVYPKLEDAIEKYNNIHLTWDTVPGWLAYQKENFKVQEDFEDSDLPDNCDDEDEEFETIDI